MSDHFRTVMSDPTAASRRFSMLRALRLGIALIALCGSVATSSAAEIETKPVSKFDWSSVDRAKWMDASKSLDRQAVLKWYEQNRLTNSFLLAASANTLAVRPGEYQTIQQRQAYYDLMTFVLELAPETPQALRDIRFFHATAIVTTRMLVGYVETRSATKLSIPSELADGQVRSLLTKVNQRLFEVNMGTLSKLLGQTKRPTSPLQPNSVVQVPALRFDLEMVDLEQGTVDTFLAKEQPTPQVLENLNSVLRLSSALQPMRNWSDMAAEAGYSDKNFADGRWRRAIGRAAVHELHGLGLPAYKKYMIEKIDADRRSAGALDDQPEQYADLINYCPPQAAQDAFLSRPDAGSGRFQPIHLASGSQTNIDYYEVVLSRLPALPGKAGPATPAEFFQYVRRNLASLLDAKIAKLEPESPRDGERWAGNSPQGAVLVFKINPASPVVRDIESPLSEQAAVVVGDMSVGNRAMSWRFVTVHTKVAGDHPVSGTREFGLKQEGALWKLYTRGADRATGLVDSAADALVFRGADLLWRSFQNNVVSLTKSGGGDARIGVTRSVRRPWVDVTGRKLFRGGCEWQSGALGQQLDARSTRATLAVVAARDPTGATAAMTAGVLNALVSTGDESARATVLSEAQALSKKLKAAATPLEVAEVSNSELGRKYGLQFARPSFDASTLRWVDPRNAGGAALLAATLIDSDARFTVTNLSSKLIDATQLPLRGDEPQRLLTALSGLPTGSTLETVTSTIADAQTRPVVTGVIKAIARGPTAPADVSALGNVLVGEAARLLGDRANEVERAIKTGTAVRDALGSPAVSDLLARNVNGDSVIGAAHVLSSLAALTGNQDLSRSIDQSMRLVQGGMEIYKNAALITGVFSGGSFVAAVGVLNGMGGIGSAFGGGNDNTAAMMKAIARLASMIMKQFEVINGKLDKMQAALDRIERDLREIKQLQKETLDEVRRTNAAVLGLYTRIDELETNLLKYMVQADADACLSHVRFARPVLLSQETFRTCLATFSRIALQPFPLVSVPDRGRPLRVLIGSYGEGQAVDPVVRYAGVALLSETEGQLFQDVELIEIAALERESKHVASSTYAVEGANAYSALVRRRGERRIRPDEVSEYATVHRLSAVVERLERVEAFRSRYAGELDQQKDRLLRLVKMYEEAQPQAVQSFVEQRRKAVSEQLVPSLSADQSFPYKGAIRACDGGGDRYSLSEQELKALSLPAIAHSRGGGYWHRSENGGSLQFQGALPGLDICVKAPTYRWFAPQMDFGGNLDIDQARRWVVVDLSLQVQVRIFGQDVVTDLPATRPRGTVTTEYYPPGVRPAETVLFSMIRPQVIDVLQRVFADPKIETVLRDRMASALLASDNLYVQARNLAAVQDLAQVEASTSKALDEGTERLDASLAMLRGRLQVAFPGVYAANDSLRKLLEGNESTRAPDRGSVDALVACAGIWTRFLEKSGNAVDWRVGPSAEQLSELCNSRVRPPWFSVSGFKELAPVFAGSGQALRERVLAMDLSVETQYGSSSPAAAAARLKSFMTDASKPGFFPEPER